MAANYWLEIDGERQGPYALPELRELWSAGKIPADARIASTDEGVFYALQTMDYLFEPGPREAPPSPRARPARKDPLPLAAPPQVPAARKARAPEKDERAPVGKRPGGGARIAALCCAMMAPIPLVLSLFLPHWVMVAVPLEPGRSTAPWLEIREGPLLVLAGIQGDKQELVKRSEFLRLWKGSPEEFGGLRPEQGDQTAMLLIATSLIIGLGAAFLLLASAVIQFGKRRISGAGAVSMIAALLGLVCLGAAAFLGIAMGARALPLSEVALGIGYVFAVASAVLLFIGGIALQLGVRAEERMRRAQRSKRRMA